MKLTKYEQQNLDEIKTMLPFIAGTSVDIRWRNSSGILSAPKVNRDMYFLINLIELLRKDTNGT